MKIAIGSAVRCTSDYMLGWSGIVVDYRWCGRKGCPDKECTYLVSWTVPVTGEKLSLSHMDNIYEIPAMVYIAEQCQ